MQLLKHLPKSCIGIRGPLVRLPEFRPTDTRANPHLGVLFGLDHMSLGKTSIDERSQQSWQELSVLPCPLDSFVLGKVIIRKSDEGHYSLNSLFTIQKETSDGIAPFWRTNNSVRQGICDIADVDSSSPYSVRSYNKSIFTIASIS